MLLMLKALQGRGQQGAKAHVLAAFGPSSHLSCGRGQQGATAYVLAPHFVQNYCGQDAKAYVLALLGCNMHL